METQKPITCPYCNETIERIDTKTVEYKCGTEEFLNGYQSPIISTKCREKFRNNRLAVIDFLKKERLNNSVAKSENIEIVRCSMCNCEFERLKSQTVITLCDSHLIDQTIILNNIKSNGQIVPLKGLPVSIAIVYVTKDNGLKDFFKKD